MATKTLTIFYSPGGVATDFDSTPVLKDAANTFGIKETVSGTVAVAAGTAFTHTGTGSYSYSATGLTAGLSYTYAIKYVAGGATTYVQETFTTPPAIASGLYSTDFEVDRLLGSVNAEVASDLNSDGISATERLTRDGAHAEAKTKIDAALNVAGLTVPATDDARYAWVQFVADRYSAVALARSRGEMTINGKPVDAYAGMRGEADAMLAKLIEALQDEAAGDVPGAAGSFSDVSLRKPVCAWDENAGWC